MGTCATVKQNGGVSKKKSSISSKKTSSSIERLPDLMKLEIACMEFEYLMKQQLRCLQRVFEANQRNISLIIESGIKTNQLKIKDSSMKLLNSMHLIKVVQILLESCSAIEDETQNLSNNVVINLSIISISNIIWSASKLKDLVCIQDFKKEVEGFIDLQKIDLMHQIDPVLRNLFLKIDQE